MASESFKGVSDSGWGNVHGISHGMTFTASCMSLNVIVSMIHNCFDCLASIKSDLSHCWSYFFFKADSVTKLNKLRNSLVI